MAFHGIPGLVHGHFAQAVHRNRIYRVWAKRQVMEHPTLMDDVPFTVAVRRSMALAQLIIRTTLSQDDLVVTDVRCQEKVPGVGYKGVVFDALCFDGCGNMYDVEVQKGRFEDLPKRAAFYEAMLTVHSLEVGSHGYTGMRVRLQPQER